MSKRPTLSAAMIVRDEEALLPAALASVRPVADEIVVGIDSRTMDRSEEIAREHGARTFRFEWADSFAEARNLTLDRARKDWVLVIDADDRLTALGQRIVKAFVSRPDPRVLAYSFHIAETRTSGELAAIAPSSARLFPASPAYRYHRRVHEEVRYRGEPIPEGRLGLVDGIAIEHVGYDPDLYADREKDWRNVRLLLKWAVEQPSDAWAWYYLARQHAFMGRIGPAVSAAEHALSLGGLHGEAEFQLRQIRLGGSPLRSTISTPKESTYANP